MITRRLATGRAKGIKFALSLSLGLQYQFISNLARMEACTNFLGAASSYPVHFSPHTKSSSPPLSTFVHFPKKSPKLRNNYSQSAGRSRSIQSLNCKDRKKRIGKVSNTYAQVPTKIVSIFASVKSEIMAAKTRTNIRTMTEVASRFMLVRCRRNTGIINTVAATQTLRSLTASVMRASEKKNTSLPFLT